jgi:hypothetical protein
MARSLSPSLGRSLIRAAAIGALSLPALCQGFNVDFGSFNGAPSSTYAAGGTQPGVWNNVANVGSAPLLDLTGAPSPVSVNTTFGNFFFGFDNLNTTGDDELLLDAGIDGATDITFSGLGNGNYIVYTYCFAPDNRLSFFTNVTVDNSPDPLQTVGGTDWSGSHAQFVTYAKHTVQVTAGTLTIHCTLQSGFVTVNGVQVEPTGPICFPPKTYCTAKMNSVGCTPAIGFAGTPSIAAQSGFAVIGYNVRNQKSGLLFYGTTGQVGVPFQGGTLCVASPIRRTPAVSSGGAILPLNNCSGIYAIDMNSFASGQLGGTPSPQLQVLGTLVSCQWWGRDPGFPAPNNTTLTNGLQYTVCP